ncbi:hypothetical protein ATY77_14870 [Rhizobium sp. R634]|nr:hypothetical protein ATY77_14870 [Rhizobium sp. R634]
MKDVEFRVEAATVTPAACRDLRLARRSGRCRHSAAEIEHLSRLDDAQASITDLLNNFEAMQFFLRHGDQTGQHDSDRSWSRPG